MALVAVLISLSSSGCSGEKSEREQARGLLEAISALDIDATPSSRTRQLGVLVELPLRDPELAKVRDQCARAHEGLLRAELEQDKARSALEQAAERYKDGGIPPEQTQAIADRISGSNRALSAAMRALPVCERQTIELAKRFR